MTTKLCSALLIVCGVLGHFGHPPIAIAEEREPLMPGAARGKLRYASGDLDSTGGTVEDYRFTPLERNRFAGRVPGAKGRSFITAEIVPGALKSPCPLIVLQMRTPVLKGANPGHAAIFVGKRVRWGRYEGTWYNNQGDSGQFELVLRNG
jgi:hypothetical protein